MDPEHVLSRNHVQPYVESRGVQLFDATGIYWPCLEQDEAQRKHDLHTSMYLERIYTAYSENGLLVAVGIPGFGDLNLQNDFFFFPYFSGQDIHILSFIYIYIIHQPSHRRFGVFPVQA